ncbi:MAG: sulfite exporter TauE/SafE family protein [Pyrinomonadaceae bacterium]|nr:sulfite exporter TauE/SafE family protein [Pyrinomonadaceae bacterium]
MNSIAGFAAFFLGAMHALEPGHNKAAITAYAVGYDNNLRHVLLLGLLTAITHTATIFALAFIFGATLSASATDEQTHQYIEIFSASLLLITGAWLLRRAFLQSRKSSEFHETQTECGCHKKHRVASDKEKKQPLSLGVVGLLAISSGLIPCPTALAVLLAAMTEGHFTSGLLTVCLFSFGIGLTLCAVAFLAGIISQSNTLKNRAASFATLSRFAGYAPLISALIITASGFVTLFRAVFYG